MYSKNILNVRWAAPNKKTVGIQKDDIKQKPMFFGKVGNSF